MKKFKISLVALSIFALLLVSMPTTSSQNINDSEVSPLTSSSSAAQTPRKPKAKLIRVENPIFNRYIVVLNEDVVSPGASLNVRRSQVRAVAENLEQLHGGTLGFIYDTALKGFSIELPSEAGLLLSVNIHVLIGFKRKEASNRRLSSSTRPGVWIALTRRHFL